MIKNAKVNRFGIFYVTILKFNLKMSQKDVTCYRTSDIKSVTVFYQLLSKLLLPLVLAEFYKYFVKN